MSQYSIAKEVGVTESYVSALLRNNYKVSSGNLQKMYIEKKKGREREDDLRIKLKKNLTE